jgi:hypothetical protein
LKPLLKGNWWEQPGQEQLESLRLDAGTDQGILQQTDDSEHFKTSKRFASFCVQVWK